MAVYTYIYKFKCQHIMPYGRLFNSSSQCLLFSKFKSTRSARSHKTNKHCIAGKERVLHAFRYFVHWNINFRIEKIRNFTFLKNDFLQKFFMIIVLTSKSCTFSLANLNSSLPKLYSTSGKNTLTYFLYHTSILLRKASKFVQMCAEDSELFFNSI